MWIGLRIRHRSRIRHQSILDLLLRGERQPQPNSDATLGSSGKTQPKSYGLYRLGKSQPKSAVPKVAEANPRAHLIYFAIRISPTQHTGKSQSKLQLSTVYLWIRASTLSAVTRPSLTNMCETVPFIQQEQKERSFMYLEHNYNPIHSDT